MPSPVRPWPYAALALINWLHTAPNLYLWIVFRHPMNQTVKPPLNTWIVDVDGVPKTPAVSAWQDEWTLLLTVNAIALLPSAVTVEFSGPDENLLTTWGKQWEPWGPIVAASFQIIPVGTIVIWRYALNLIPAGWVLCDGNNGTPDLHGLFLLPTTNPAQVDFEGGNRFHDHDFTGDGHFHGILPGVPSNTQIGTGIKARTEYTNVTGTTDTTDGRPPFKRFGFIMKV